jgi:hypothetical protein
VCSEPVGDPRRRTADGNLTVRVRRTDRWRSNTGPHLPARTHTGATVTAMAVRKRDFAPYIPTGKRRPCSFCGSESHGAYITLDRTVACSDCYRSLPD